MRTTGPAQPDRLLLDVVDHLAGLGIPNAVIDAFAVSYYGVPRSTTDADPAIWLAGTGKSPQNVVEYLIALGYHAELRRGEANDPISQVIVVEDSHDNRMDILAGLYGMDPGAVHRCVTAPLLDSSIRILGVEDLIAMKVFAGGPQDLQDVRGILQVSGTFLNMDLLQQLALRYGPGAHHELNDLVDEQHRRC